MPFVKPQLAIFKNIQSDETPIFTSEYTCFIDSIIATNQVNRIIQVFLKTRIMIGEEQEMFPLVNYFSLNPYQHVDLMKETKCMHVPYGHSIYAYSDAVDNLFSVHLSYRELTELGGPNGF